MACCEGARSPSQALYAHVSCDFCDEHTDEYVTDLVHHVLSNAPEPPLPSDCIGSLVRGFAAVAVVCEHFEIVDDDLSALVGMFDAAFPGQIETERTNSEEDRRLPDTIVAHSFWAGLQRQPQMAASLSSFGVTGLMKAQFVTAFAPFLKSKFAIRSMLFALAIATAAPLLDESAPTPLVTVFPDTAISALELDFPFLIVADQPKPAPRPTEPAPAKSIARPAIVDREPQPLDRALSFAKPWQQDDRHAMVEVVSTCLVEPSSLDRIAITLPSGESLEPITPQAASRDVQGWYVAKDDQLGISFGNARPSIYEVRMPVSCWKAPGKHKP